MAILKSEIRNKFTSIPNSVIRTKDLSDAEYRLLIYLYSLPDGWKINQGYLGNELNCSRININKKLRKIKENGYLEINKSDDDNTTDYIYILKEKGVSLDDVSVSDVSPSDVSVSDTHINTNIINTDITNTNINNYIVENSKSETIKKIIEYLNLKTGSNYKYSTKATNDKINARLNEGFKLDDFIAVIDKKCMEWLNTDYEKFLRPETLFGTKFESYLNQKSRIAQDSHKAMTKEELDAWELQDD